MKKKIVYANEPLGNIEMLPDFLPAPAELAFRDESVKVTLALSKRSVDFFKSAASEHQTQYQRMIRCLLDSNVDAQKNDSISVRSTQTGNKQTGV